MNVESRLLRHRARSITTALVFLVCAGTAWADTYYPATSELTIPSVSVGGATYFNVLVTIARLVSGPPGTPANGDEDSYDTASGQLTVPSMTVGSTTYYNVVATVRDFVSVGQVSGADTYSTSLVIPYVQVGGTVYKDVAISVDRVVTVLGGIPRNPRDVYDPVTHHLTIAAVQVGSHVYTNVVVIPGTVLSVGGVSPQVTLGGLIFNCIVNSACNAQTTLLINSGTTSLNLGGVSLPTPVHHYQLVFETTNNCHASLGPGQSCAISVRMACIPSWAYSATLSVSDNGAGSPQTAWVSGQCHY